MLYSCLLDHRSWFAPSTCHSKPICVLWKTSKSVTDAKLYVGKAEIYQVKKKGRRKEGKKRRKKESEGKGKEREKRKGNKRLREGSREA